MQYLFRAFLPAISLSILLSLPSRAADPMSDQDRQMLDKLIGNLLTDPTGAQRVRVKVSVRTVWSTTEEVTREGWLKPAAPGQPVRVYFAGGNSIPAPADKDLVQVDFIADCEKRFAGTRPPQQDEDREKIFAQMRQTAIGDAGADESPLVLAAWLHRLANDNLASEALKAARASTKTGAPDQAEGIDPADTLRNDLAWEAFAGMVHAYMVRADDEAMAYAAQFQSLNVQDKQYAQSPLIIEELRRRQARGAANKTPSTQPGPDYAQLSVDRKIAFWIDALDEVDARQMGQPGGIDLSADPRVAALIEIGEPAVPALIDTVEKDKRLTRSVHFWRDFSKNRTVLGVREAALTAVMSILRVQVFEPASTGDSFTARDEIDAGQTVSKLRAYWEKYGKLPFDQRMMTILTDPASSFEATREAADNLATLVHSAR
jgi:hypothetical protein